MLPALPNVRIDLASLPENVGLIRETIAGLATAIGLEDGDLHDIKVAVSEAASNVVSHAYGDGRSGPLEVDLHAEQSELIVLVRDRGIGMTGATRGIGSSVIETLASRAEFRERPGGGTEVAMVFKLATPVDEVTAAHGSPLLAALTASGFDAAVQVAIAPAALGPAVLGRLVSVLASRARFSIDRVSDLQLLTDAVAAHVSPAVDGSYLGVGIAVEPRRIELRVGPFRTGRTRAVVAASSVGGIGSIIERLADIDVREAGSHEVLALVMEDSPVPA